MAKSARASSKKVNHKKLRARVFAPVEKARAERLHAKLLETIQQPKPEQTKMDTTEDCEIPRHVSAPTFANTLEATSTESTKENDLPKGSSFLTARIPLSLYNPSNTMPDPAQDNCDMRNLCLHLGLCSDIIGFNEGGDLTFAFDPLPPHWLSENQGLTVT